MHLTGLSKSFVKAAVISGLLGLSAAPISVGAAQIRYHWGKGEAKEVNLQAAPAPAKQAGAGEAMAGCNACITYQYGAGVMRCAR